MTEHRKKKMITILQVLGHTWEGSVDYSELELIKKQLRGNFTFTDDKQI
jgi:hypothetical protein